MKKIIKKVENIFGYLEKPMKFYSTNPISYGFKI